MKPIYFPFTYVPRWVAEALAACFRQFIVYQPSGRKLPPEMQSWVEANVMEVRVPVKTEDDALAKAVKNFKVFADLHDDSRNIKTAAVLNKSGTPPFFDESAVSRIVSEVKKGNRMASVRENFDPLFDARVFLDFAHEFDRQLDEINRGLGENDRRSRDLLKKMRGELENGLPAHPLTAEIKVEDPGEYGGLGRLRAWLSLYMVDPVDSGLFVTGSPAVFNLLADAPTVAEKNVQLKGLPLMDPENDSGIARPDLFIKRMQQVFENSGSAADHAFIEIQMPNDLRSKFRLTLYRVPDLRPADFFIRVSEARNLNTGKPAQKAELTHTLIGLIGQRSSHP